MGDRFDVVAVDNVFKPEASTTVQRALVSTLTTVSALLSLDVWHRQVPERDGLPVSLDWSPLQRGFSGHLGPPSLPHSSPTLDLELV